MCASSASPNPSSRYAAREGSTHRSIRPSHRYSRSMASPCAAAPGPSNTTGSVSSRRRTSSRTSSSRSTQNTQLKWRRPTSTHGPYRCHSVASGARSPVFTFSTVAIVVVLPSVHRRGGRTRAGAAAGRQGATARAGRRRQAGVGASEEGGKQLRGALQALPPASAASSTKCRL